MDHNSILKKAILVVDDEPMILKMVSTILENKGYCVLQAPGPLEALRMESEYSGVIDLLLSDITMPGMMGPELAAHMIEHRPGMRVMFMSGYAEGPLLVLNYGWQFLQKPFIGEALLEMVDEVLHSPTRSKALDHFDTRQ